MQTKRTIRNICWLAGLLDGEGYFGRIRSLALRLRMTDRDVVERAAKIMGTSVMGPYSPGKRGTKLVYVAVLYGSRAASWMMILYSELGLRNKNRVKQQLSFWRMQSNRWSNVK